MNQGPLPVRFIIGQMELETIKNGRDWEVVLEFHQYFIIGPLSLYKNGWGESGTQYGMHCTKFLVIDFELTPFAFCKECNNNNIQWQHIWKFNCARLKSESVLVFVILLMNYMIFLEMISQIVSPFIRGSLWFWFFFLNLMSIY